MSRLSDLLRKSKIAQVVTTSKEFVAANARDAFLPRHQIIETKPALLHRREWGLKNQVPVSSTGKNSRYMVFNELDTQERMTNFEKLGGSQYTRLRFRELNTAPTYNPGTVNPLFQSSSVKNDYSTPFASLSNLRVEDRTNTVNSKLKAVKNQHSYFRNWLAKNDPSAAKNKIFNQRNLKNSAIEFLQKNDGSNKKNSSLRLNKSMMNHVIGTGGLTYTLTGRLRNSPNGIIQKTVVPGRFLDINNNNRLSAIGGFISQTSSSTNSRSNYEAGDFIRQMKFPFEIKRASVEANGKLIIYSTALNERSHLKNLEVSSRTYQQRPKETKKDEDEARSTANDLLEILASSSMNPSR